MNLFYFTFFVSLKPILSAFIYFDSFRYFFFFQEFDFLDVKSFLYTYSIPTRKRNLSRLGPPKNIIIASRNNKVCLSGNSLLEHYHI